MKMKNTNNTGQNGIQNILERNTVHFQQISKLLPINLTEKNPAATKTFETTMLSFKIL